MDHYIKRITWANDQHTNLEIHKLYQLQSASLAQVQSRCLPQSWSHSKYIPDSLPNRVKTLIKLREHHVINFADIYSYNNFNQDIFFREKTDLEEQSFDLHSRQHHSQIGLVHEERSIHMGDAKLPLFLSNAQEWKED